MRVPWSGPGAREPYLGVGERMSGIRYSSLRYLLPLEVRGEAWSSRFRWRVMFIPGLGLVLGVGDWRRLLVRVGRGWMGDGVE